MSLNDSERRDVKINAIDVEFERCSLATTPVSLSSSPSSEIYVRVRFLRDDAKALFKATKGSAGYDICSVRDITIGKRSSAIVDTGLSLEIPEGVYGNIKGRSGLAFKRDIIAFDGTIDSDYRGEIKIKLFNHGKKNYSIVKGDRIAQIIFTPLERVYIGYRDAMEDNDDEDDDDDDDDEDGKASILRANERKGYGFGSSGR